MSLTLQINREDNRAVYQQIAAQIKNQISVGRLPAGTRLPSVRQMAEMLDVNRLTVHNAYSELQADGWVESTVGRGTFVSPQAQPLMLLSSVGEETTPDSVLNDIHSIKQMPTLRSLAYAEPDPSLFPVDEFWGTLAGLRREAATLLSYDSPQGDPMLRVELAALVGERGIDAMPDEILVTQGAMQGLSLVSQTLAEPGDTVLVEQPTYLGFIHILKKYGLNPIPIPWDSEGPNLNALEQAIHTYSPRFMYTVPTFQNPTGYSATENRRIEVVELATKHRLLVVEDDIYGQLSYNGSAPVPMKTYETCENVIYIGSISKMLMPGLRIGWVVAPPEMIRRLISLKLASDIFGPGLIQRALAHYLHQGRLKAHLKRTLPVYKARRDALLRGLERYMPPGVTWTKPAGGFSNWVTLPQSNMRTLYQAALKRGIAFTPGEAFLVAPDNRHLRLCFGNQPAEDLDMILAQLGEIFHDHVYERCLEPEDSSLWTALV